MPNKLKSSIKPKTKKPIVWTIAGSDSGGGAGVQADLQTFKDFSVHGCSVITAVTAQNSVALQHTHSVGTESVQAQIRALAEDLPAAAIKLGMLADKATVKVVSEYLKQYQGVVVCDPVLATSTGGLLLNKEAALFFVTHLLPRIDLLTPNVPEAKALTGMDIVSEGDVVNAAKRLVKLGARSVLLTGGHWRSHNGCRLDYWTDGEQGFWLSGEDIDSVNSHGSGCTLSAAIAALLAQGYLLADAMVIAKAYVTQGIRLGERVGKGPGPIAHTGWPMSLADLPVLVDQLPQQQLKFQDCGSDLGLYPVVDSIAWIGRLVTLGVPTIQLRLKNLPMEIVAQKISDAVALCKPYKTRLFINDYWQLAIELGAYGVHLGQEDLADADLEAIAEAGLKLGISTHSYYEIARAHGVRPSYIAIGPVYSTKTKEMKFSALGLGQLKQWVDLLEEQYPLTAIGGISVERVPGVLATGVKSCAMVTAITQAQDYETVVKKLMKIS